jgi:hypothetical protein
MTPLPIPPGALWGTLLPMVPLGSIRQQPVLVLPQNPLPRNLGHVSMPQSVLHDFSQTPRPEELLKEALKGPRLLCQ